MQLGSVLKGQSIDTPEKAQAAFSDAVDRTRFDYVVTTVKPTNDTEGFEIKLLLFQGLFQGNWQQPQGYQTATGVVVGGANVTRGSSQTVPLQAGIRVQATRIQSSVQWLYDGEERPAQNYPDQVAPEGQYFVWAYFTFGISRSERGEAVPTLQFHSQLSEKQSK
jgi:hypothetical protein